MSNLASANHRARSSSWQKRLQDHCRSAQLHPPVFNIVSDRRGGRTAWSSTVTLTTPSHQTVQARYWYDGQYVNNAKEDAAEVALRTLTTTTNNNGSPSSPGSSPHNARSPTTSTISSPASLGWGGSAGSNSSGSGSSRAGYGGGPGQLGAGAVAVAAGTVVGNNAWPPRSAAGGRWGHVQFTG